MILMVKCPQSGSRLGVKDTEEKYRQNRLADRMCLKLKYTQWELIMWGVALCEKICISNLRTDKKQVRAKITEITA